MTCRLGRPLLRQCKSPPPPRLLGISQKLSLMIAVGTAVCGGTAIAAIAPVIKARDEEFSFAVSVNMVMGMLAVLCFPLIGHALGWDDRFFGMWAGTAVNDTAQVLATGYAYSPAAGQTATIIKLVRNSLMVFVVVGAGFYYRGLEVDAISGAKKVSFVSRVKESVPGFVLGFLFLVRDWRRAAVPLAVAGGTFAATIYFYLHSADPELWIKTSVDRVLGTTMLCLFLAAAAGSEPRGADAARAALD